MLVTATQFSINFPHNMGSAASGAGLIVIDVGVRQLAIIVPDNTIAAHQSHFPFD